MLEPSLLPASREPPAAARVARGSSARRVPLFEQSDHAAARNEAPAALEPAEDVQFRIGQQRNSSSSGGSSTSTEHRNTITRRSIVYPLVGDLSAVVQQPVGLAAASHAGSSVFPARTRSRRSSGEFSARRAHMQTFPLRFRDAGLDDVFCKHYNVYVVNKVRTTTHILAGLFGAMLAAQYVSDARSMRGAVAASRVAVVALALVLNAASYSSAFNRHFDQLMLAHYVLDGLALSLPRFLFLYRHWDADPPEEVAAAQHAVFCSQKSVRISLLLYVLLVYTASGMRFTTASVCLLVHVAIKLCFVVAFCRHCGWPELDFSASLSLAAFCMLAAFYGERNVRQEFVERIRVTEERKRRDDLLETMLPVHIKESLKHTPRTDALADYHEEVSILFCYISNFQVLSRHASAIDLVKLMNRIVFCFDKATDLRGVYKVEAIAETYMCAAGLLSHDPFHCDKIADMALTMMRICEMEQWTFNGVDIQLQIGIHAGPVVAGVVGSKTYSYHLFGDTVNTSSRICSSCTAGKIQISDRVRQLLARSGSYIISERGATNLKGKGSMKLFWLEGKYVKTPRSVMADVSSTFEAATEGSIRNAVAVYAPNHRSDEYISYMNNVDVSKWTLTFRCNGVSPTLGPTLAGAKVAPVANPLAPASTTKGAVDVASEMETVFRKDHARESTHQFLLTVQLSACVLLFGIIARVYREETATKGAAIAYILDSVALCLLLAIALLLKKYQQYFKLDKETAAVMGCVVVVPLMNLQPLFQDKETFDSSSHVETCIVQAAVFGLVLRLRFPNAAVVSAWNFAMFASTAAVVSDTWTQQAENLSLLLMATAIALRFGYKREAGIRSDFLLKCTLRLEKQKCEDLLSNMLPSAQYAEALMMQSTVVDELAEVTLLYSDMVGFTTLGARLKPGDICVLLNKIYSAFDSHLDEFGVYKMDTVGDAFIVIGGLPNYKSTKHHAAAVTAFAIEMLHEIDRFCAEANVSLQMRIGIHTGKVVGGVVGIKKPRYLIWGHHTVVANMMESRGVPGRVQISEDTFMHLRNCPEFRMEERIGRVQISDSDSMRTYYLAKDHPSVKDQVTKRYLQERRALNLHALEQLRSCLNLTDNSPLSRHLEATRQGPAPNRPRSFVDIITR